MSRPVRTIDASAWVDAAPFAAHLHQLCAVSGLPWQVIATFAGIPLRTAARLVPAVVVPGRTSARLRRIPRQSAQRLWSVQADDLHRLRSTYVEAASTRVRLAHLVAAGVPPHRLAVQLDCPLALVASLVEGGPTWVTAEIAVRARVACETADRALARRALTAA